MVDENYLTKMTIKVNVVNVNYRQQEACFARKPHNAEFSA